MTKFTVGAQMYSVRTLLQTEEDMKAAFAQLKAMGFRRSALPRCWKKRGCTAAPRTFPSIGWKKMWTAASRTTRR